MFLLEQVKEMIKDCFVTGKWDASEDAQALLDLDGIMSSVLKLILIPILVFN